MQTAMKSHNEYAKFGCMRAPSPAHKQPITSYPLIVERSTSDTQSTIRLTSVLFGCTIEM